MSDIGTVSACYFRQKSIISRHLQGAHRHRLGQEVAPPGHSLSGYCLSCSQAGTLQGLDSSSCCRGTSLQQESPVIPWQGLLWNAEFRCRAALCQTICHA